VNHELNRVYRLRRRPRGPVASDDLEFVHELVPAPREGQALIRTLWLSIDPSNRIWMSDVEYLLPPVAIGAVMRGFGIGEIAESRHPGLKRGDLVSGLLGWAEYVLVDVAGGGTAANRSTGAPPRAAVRHAWASR
jgi:NADPH-dependent curcumin reductase CurA